VKIETKPVCPTQVVEHAAKLWRKDRDVYDEVWCVVDVDEFTDIPQALAAARKHGIELVVSNPCFELWLLLRLEPCTHHLSPAQALNAVRRHLRDYNKSCRFSDFSAGLDDARDRAVALDPSGSGVHLNPSTNVWKLVDRIR
jgi:hypothetical protein